MKLYSKSCEYAILALASIERGTGNEPFSLKDACKKAHIPESITRKSFQTLVRKGILAAKRGCGGGYRFRGSPKNVTLLDVIQAIDGKGSYEVCVLGNPECSNKAPCALHSIWGKAKTMLLSELSSKSINILK